MSFRIGRHVLVVTAALTCSQRAGAQVFVSSPSQLPGGAASNDFRRSEVDFADIDLDGDWDVGIARGGDCCNDENLLWANQGGAQGGTAGFFADVTATQAPAISDQSRDLEFVDFDGDGDPDVHVSNTSQISNQASRWWVNLGGLQGASAGFYADETAQRWIGIGGVGSSISAGQVLGSGGYITFAHDHDFADLDNDGDLDLVASAVGNAFSGQEPTRVFLNDGLGYFSEFNPSGFKLAGLHIQNGNPALWCEGVQQNGTTNTTGAFADIATACTEVSLGDIEGDLDVDALLGDRFSTPRMFRNRLEETGTLAFRDATGLTWPAGAVLGNGHYEQDFADFDCDDDLDLYGLNWTNNFSDAVLRGAGDGTFVEPAIPPGSAGDDSSLDFIDYDGDGDLDVFVCHFSGADRLLANEYAGGPLAFSLVSDAVSGVGSSNAEDVDVADLDSDGDYDLMRSATNVAMYLKNVGGGPDTGAPRLAKLEQPSDHSSGLATPIRVQHYDNAPDYLAVAGVHELVHSVDGGPFASAPMRWSGGQILRGELPAAAVGNVRYFVRSADEHGNTGISKLKAIDTSGGCSGQPATYCLGKLNTDGCVPRIEFEGAPEVGGPTSFTIRGVDVLANVNGLLIYSKNGAGSAPFHGGTLCIGAGLLRTPGQNSGGAGPCGGTLSFDFNAYAGLGSDPGLVAGQKVWAQYWYRDIASQGGTGLTDGVTFTLCP